MVRLTTTGVIAILALVLVAVSCGTADPVEEPDASLSGTSDAAPPSSTASATPSSTAPDDIARQIAVAELLANPDGLVAFGGTDLVFDAYLARVGAVDGPGGLKPEWFAQLSMAVLIGEPGGAYPNPGTAVWAVIHPDVAELREQAMDRVVSVTAHYDDPAAATCRYDPYQSFPGDQEPPREEVVAMCRSTLVIIGIGPTTP